MRRRKCSLARLGKFDRQLYDDSPCFPVIRHTDPFFGCRRELPTTIDFSAPLLMKEVALPFCCLCVCCVFLFFGYWLFSPRLLVLFWCFCSSSFIVRRCVCVCVCVCVWWWLVFLACKTALAKRAPFRCSCAPKTNKYHTSSNLPRRMLFVWLQPLCSTKTRPLLSPWPCTAAAIQRPACLTEAFVFRLVGAYKKHVSNSSFFLYVCVCVCL